MVVEEVTLKVNIIGKFKETLGRFNDGLKTMQDVTEGVDP